MKLEGGCYCGGVRYQIDGEPIFKGQCHCRECQFYTGGQPNMVIGVPNEAFSLFMGDLASYSRDDVDGAVTREWCKECGTQMWAQSPHLGDAFIVRAGTLDDPKAFGMPGMAIFKCDALPYHPKTDDIPSFDKTSS